MRQLDNGCRGLVALKRNLIWILPLLLVMAVWLGQPVLGSPEGPERITLSEAQHEAREENRQIEMALRSLRMANASVDLLEEELEDLREQRDEMEEIDLRVDLEIPLDELFEGLRLDELLDELNIDEEVDLEDEVITIPIDIESEELEELLDTEELDEGIKELENEKEKAERGVSTARLGYYEAIEEVELGVLEMFTGIVILDKQMTIQEETLKRMEEMLRLELEKYYAGEVTELEVEEMRSQIRELETAVDMMKNSREQAVERLVDLIGRSPGADLRAATYQPDQPETVDFNNLLSKEMDTNYALRRAELEVKNAKDDKDLARELHGTDSPQYEMAEEELALARLERENERMEARHALLSDYHAVQEAEAELSNREDDLEMAEKEYDTAKVSYDQGYITNTEFAMARLELMEAEMDLEEARFEYHTALTQLKAIRER